ncbi:hypothetical protein [Parvularcula sp. IMCC14364]|uniref:hypothetical protein n=1 Tax=Parvularcula sp. IMCC14364 TaxID=3067902 RepID=UPI002741D329|nr:hypothetical protein [Parvularcula sp. IMCC14364]
MTHNEFSKSGLYNQVRGGAFVENKPANPISILFTGLMVVMAIGMIALSIS